MGIFDNIIDFTLTSFFQLTGARLQIVLTSSKIIISLFKHHIIKNLTFSLKLKFHQRFKTYAR